MGLDTKKKFQVFIVQEQLPNCWENILKIAANPRLQVAKGILSLEKNNLILNFNWSEA